MTGKHHPLSASTAERWLECSGAYALIPQAPPGSNAPTIEAAEGTMLHSRTEEQLTGWLNTGKIVEQALGSKYTVDGFTFDFTAEHREAVRMAVTFVVDLIKTSGVGKNAVKLEWRVIVPTQWEATYPEDGPLAGILDCAITVALSGTLHIIDFKYGKGVKVSPVDNKQLKYYGLGAYLAMAPDVQAMIDNVRFYIVQPRHYSGGAIEVWGSDVEILPAFHVELENGVQRILNKDFVLNVGSWCRWCPAKSICKAYQEHNFETVAQITGSTVDDFKGVDFKAMLEPAKTLPAPAQLTDEALGAILRRRKTFYEFMENAEAEAMKRLANKKVVPGCSTKPKRSNREWFDEPGAADALAEAVRDSVKLKEFRKTGLKTPTQVETELKRLQIKLDLSEYIRKPDNGLTLAVEGE